MLRSAFKLALDLGHPYWTVPEMIRLSEAQFQAFRDLARDRFFSDAAAFLKERFPEESARLSDSDLSHLLQAAIERGKEFGVASAYDIRRFAECLLLYGEDFPLGESHGWARALLEDDSMSGREKMNTLVLFECFNGRP